MIKDISTLEDIHIGETVVVSGHGPSLNNQREAIETAQREQKIRRISLNNWWNFYNDPPDYHFICNPLFTLKSIDTDMKAIGLECPPVIDCESFVNRPARDHEHPAFQHIDVFPYNLFSGGVTIRDLVAKKFNDGENAQSGAWLSGAMIAIDFAFFMGFSRILMVGIDLHWEAGYANPVRYEGLPHWFRRGLDGRINSPDTPRKGTNEFLLDAHAIKPMQKFVDRATRHDIEFAYLGNTPWYAETAGLTKKLLS